MANHSLVDIKDHLKVKSKKPVIKEGSQIVQVMLIKIIKIKREYSQLIDRDRWSSRK
jgi:hypothetical protein